MFLVTSKLTHSPPPQQHKYPSQSVIMAKHVTPVATSITTLVRSNTAYIDIELSSTRKVINKCLTVS